MASSKEYLDFVLEQLSDISDISYRAMMGEYIIYYCGKVIGGIYDNRLLVKPTTSMIKFISKPVMEPPYPGAKPMYLVSDVDNRDLLMDIVIDTCKDL